MKREQGFALVTVVVLMLGLALLATGLLFSASQQNAVVLSLLDLARARRGAETAVTVALDGWSAARRTGDPVGASVTLLEGVPLEPGISATVSTRRLSGGVWLVESSALALRGGLPPIRQSARRLVHSTDLDAVGRAIDAALLAGRIRIANGASVDGLEDGPTEAEPGAAELCARWTGDGAALRAPADSVDVAPAGRVDGAFVPDSAALQRVEDPGGLPVAHISASARAVAASGWTRVTPRAVADGAACDTVPPSNWGAPDGPCATHYVTVRADEGLEVQGGYGQGILIAHDRLVLDGGFRFRGIILGRGEVIVRDARIDGSILAATIEMEGGRARLDRCAVAEALLSDPAVLAARPPARSWLPTFD